MHYDKQLAALFIKNLDEAYRSARLLAGSYTKIRPLIPIRAETIDQLGFSELETIDAFRVRFCDLQDCLGRKVFRTLLSLEEEKFSTQLDILNKMEKRELITSFDDWKELRDTRNLFSHDYPESKEQRAQAINSSFERTKTLIIILDRVVNYVRNNLGLDLSKFERILIDG